MKICVLGAGAVGGHIATRLVAAQRNDVCIIARGSALKAIRENGLVLHSSGETLQAMPVLVTDDISSAAGQDVVIVAVKAPALPAVADSVDRLLKRDGCALFLLNGIPWWWRHGLPGPSGPLKLLDPDGKLWNRVRPERTLGGIVYSSNELVEPGVINHTAGNLWLIGELDGSATTRLNAVVSAFVEAGVDAKSTRDIHREAWRKIVLNSSGNPISALTRLNFHELGAHEETRAVVKSLMNETLAVGAALGYDLRSEMDVEELSRRSKAPRDQRPHSMLWDVLTNRPLEVDALLGQTQVFAREQGVSVPTINLMVALLRGLDRANRYCNFV